MLLDQFIIPVWLWLWWIAIRPNAPSTLKVWTYLVPSIHIKEPSPHQGWHLDCLYLADNVIGAPTITLKCRKKQLGRETNSEHFSAIGLRWPALASLATGLVEFLNHSSLCYRVFGLGFGILPLLVGTVSGPTTFLVSAVLGRYRLCASVIWSRCVAKPFFGIA